MGQITVTTGDLKRLERSEARLRTILNSQPECVKTVDSRGCLLDMNPAGLAMIDVSNIEQVRGASVFDLVIPEHHELYRDGLARVFAGETVKQQYEIVGLKGTRRWVEQTATPLRDPSDPDKIIEMLAVTRDVTEQMRTNAELVKAKKNAELNNLAKTQFLTNMSHEIRTPLNGVLGMVQLLERTQLNDRQTKFAKTIRASGSALLALINDVLDISKIESGSMRLDEERFDLSSLLQDSIDTVAGMAQQKGLAVVLDFSPEIAGEFFGDAKRIKQILINLIGNAVKFTDEGRVMLSVSLEAGGGLKFAVTDTGPGIEPSERELIFGRFYQTDGSLTRKNGGTGLGLAISSDLVRLMGGKMGVESSVGEGSSFWFSLPLKIAASNLYTGDQSERIVDVKTSVSVPAALAESGNVFRVLVGEDRQDNQELIAEALKQLDGIECVMAANGQEVIDLLDTQSFDLVLMDINMPVMTGDQAIEHIRSAGKPFSNIPILVVTANALCGQREEYISCGASAYISKPINIDEILELIEQFQSKSAAYSVA